MERVIKNKEALLALVNLGIGRDIKSLLEITDWEGVKALAGDHGLSAIAFDGVSRLIENGCQVPRQIKNQWLSNVLYMFEDRYRKYEESIASLAKFYNDHGYKMMILKGYGLSLNYPQPNHRPSGDIDIWLFGQYKEADKIFSQKTGIEVDTAHHHHTVFNWKGFSVENHYDFINVHGTSSGARLEKIFKEIGPNDCKEINVCGSKIYLPSPTFHALFQLRHMLGHFSAVEIKLRHVLDWGFFVERNSSAIDWNWLLGILKEFKMNKFCAIISSICVEDLGFSPEIFPREIFDYNGDKSAPINDEHIAEGVNLKNKKRIKEEDFKALKDRVLNDIIEPEFNVESPRHLLPRLIFKFRRWYLNGWKHRLCYNESQLSIFIHGLWSHFLKPSSF